jgi:hypothetical protein
MRGGVKSQHQRPLGWSHGESSHSASVVIDKSIQDGESTGTADNEPTAGRMRRYLLLVRPLFLEYFGYCP